jgi:hypothetical protein
MDIVISNFISWQYCVLFLLVILFIIWLFWGGQEDLEYIGLAPLKIGVDASRNVEHETKEEEESVDITPNLPDLRENEDFKILPRFTNIHDTAKISLSESMEYFSPIKSPRSLALGEHTCFKNNKPSKGETLCKKAVEEIYGVPFYCVRPNFLKNPETGRNLELDMYNDDLKIAVEYSGIGHYVYPNPFHKTKEEFMNQIRRDQYKVETCDQNGIYLITVPYNVPLEYEKIKSYIEYYLPENESKRIKDKIEI